MRRPFEKPLLPALPLALAALAALAAPPARAVPCAGWKDAEKALRAAWAKGYPKEKLVTLEADGEPTDYTKVKSTGQTQIDDKGRTWEYFTKNKFCRVPAKAMVQQGANQRQFAVSAIYRVDRKSFVFEELGVGASEAVANADQAAPAKDEIKKLIAAYWLEKNPGHKVQRVATGDPELKNDGATGRWFYYVGTDLFITDEDGAEKKCATDYTMLYKGEKGAEGKDPSGPWRVGFFVDPSCN